MANDAVPEDAELGSLAITLRTYGLDYMQARHVLEKVRGLLDRASRSADTDALVTALDLLLRSVDAVLVELKPGQSLHPAGAGRTGALVSARNEARAALQQHEEKKL